MNTGLAKRLDPDAEALEEIRQLYLSVRAAPSLAGAACRRAARDLHYPVGDESSRPYRRQAARAKRVCAACPVFDTCLAYALRARETEGIWGGMTPGERRAYRRDQAQRSADAAALQPEIVTTEVTDIRSFELAGEEVA